MSYEDNGAIGTGKEALGDLARWSGRQVSGGLDALGMHESAADVRNTTAKWGRDLGSDEPEQQLGQTTDPKLLLHGDPHKMAETAQHLAKFHDAFSGLAGQLKKARTDNWEGAAGDAYRNALGPVPNLCEEVATACGDTGKAWQRYSSVVDEAQKQAAHAAQMYEEGKKLSEQARNAYNDAANAYNAARDARTPANQMPPRPGPFTDPGEAQMQHAVEMLNAARKGRDSAASTLFSAIAHMMGNLPKLPDNYQDELRDEFFFGKGTWIGAEHSLLGVAQNVTGMVKQIRAIAPIEPYNITHPNEYAKGLSTQAAGLLYVSDHPGELVKAIVGTKEQWANDHYAARANLAVNLAGFAAGGAGSAGKAGAVVAKTGAAAGKAFRATRRAAGRTVERLKNLKESRAGRAGVDHAGGSHGVGGHEPPPQTRPTPTGPGPDKFEAAAQDALGNVEKELGSINTHDVAPVERAAPTETAPSSDTPAPATHEPQPRPTESAPPPATPADPPPAAPRTATPQGQAFDEAGNKLSRIRARLDEIAPRDPGPIEREHGAGDAVAGDPYIQSNGVLKNKFDITDQRQLDDLERLFSFNRGKQIEANFEKYAHMPTKDALKAIHQKLFGDVYDWAGEYRSFKTVKHQEIDGVPLGKPEHYVETDEIPQYLDLYNNGLEKKGFLDQPTHEKFKENMAQSWRLLHQTHPFREGNSRTLGHYLSSLADRYGYKMDWTAIDRAEYLMVRNEAMYDNYKPMIDALEKMLSRK